MLELDDAEIEPLAMDGVVVPMVRMTRGDAPDVDVRLGDREYHYERSYPVKGYSAVLPGYLREQLGAGKRPLLI